MVLAILRRIVTWIHTAVHNDKYAPVAIELVSLALAVWIGIAIHRHYTPHYTDVQTRTDTKTVYVDKPVVSEKIVTKVITDPKDRETIQKLLAQNAALQGQIIQLTNTNASLQQHGGTETGGTVTTVPTTTPGVEAAHEYKDWQLDAKYQGTAFSYDLNQQFQIVTTTGKDRDGKRSELVNLFQVGPNNERIPVPAQTTAIIADNPSMHWFVRLNVQGGVNVSPGEPGGIVGVQWLKKGSSHAAEDQRWAAVTPVFFVSQNIREFSILPFSFNFGNVKHQPFTNVWISPYVGIDWAGRGPSRFGIAISSTF